MFQTKREKELRSQIKALDAALARKNELNEQMPCRCKSCLVCKHAINRPIGGGAVELIGCDITVECEHFERKADH